MYRNTFSGLLPDSWSKRRRGKHSNPTSKSAKMSEQTPSMSPTKVLVAGVNGKLGPHVIKHLTESNFAVTALTTHPVTAAETYSGIRTILADYNNVARTIPSLRGFDVLVILISRSEDAVQTALIDAAIEAGIPHIIPSAFGIDTRIPAIRENPVFTSKIAMEDHLYARVNEGKVTFTTIQTGVFLEWALGIGMGVDLSGTAPTLLFDGGGMPFSTSSHDDIGRAVANAVTLRNDERVRNKVLLIHSAVITQNQLLGYAQQLRPNVEWKTMDVDTQTAYAAALEAYERGERSPAALRGFFPRMTFGLGLGLFEPCDNQVLGIEVWGEERVKKAVEDEIFRRERR